MLSEELEKYITSLSGVYETKTISAEDEVYIKYDKKFDEKAINDLAIKLWN